MSIFRLMQMGAAAPTGPEGAWDLSYAYYDPPESLRWTLDNSLGDGARFITNSQDTNPTDVFLKPDGTKMYIVGNDGNDVNEYDLSTAWDVSSASFLQNFSVSAQDTSPEGIFFKPDGTKMYILGYDGRDVNEYDLSTAWDVSSASYLQNFSVSGQESLPNGLFFKPDGTKMYVVGISGDDVNEYDLSTAWDVSSASYLQNFSVSAQDTVPTDVFFKPDGTKMYVTGQLEDQVYEYNLSTAWDVSSASYSNYVNVQSQSENPEGLFFKPDGTKMYVVGGIRNTSDHAVNEYNLGGFDVNAQESSPEGLFFKPDGTKMYITGTSGDDVNEYDLSTAWDVSSASFLQNFSVSAQDTVPTDVFFKPDGTKMYITGTSGDDVNEYDLSTAWDVSSAIYRRVFSVAAQETIPRGLFFKPDGTKMYIVGSRNDVFEYDLSTAWIVTSASYSQELDISTQMTGPEGLFFKPDGTKMYVVGYTPLLTSRGVIEYDLSTAWSVSSASYLQNISSVDQQSKGLFFSEDGTQMFILGDQGNCVYSFTLAPQD
jgi:DNA-binding beta-propeller fold protein YncE